MIPGSFLLSSLVEVMISSVSVWMKRWETWTQQQCVRVLCWCFPKRKSCTLQKTHFEAFHIALGPGLRTCSVKHSTDSYLIPVVGFQSPLQDTWAGAVLWRAATTEEEFNLNTRQNWTVNRETSRRFSWGGSNYCHSAKRTVNPSWAVWGDSKTVVGYQHQPGSICVRTQVGTSFSVCPKNIQTPYLTYIKCYNTHQWILLSAWTNGHWDVQPKGKVVGVVYPSIQL